MGVVLHHNEFEETLQIRGSDLDTLQKQRDWPVSRLALAPGYHGGRILAEFSPKYPD